MQPSLEKLPPFGLSRLCLFSRLACTLLTLAVASVSVSAQSIYGSIVGTVTDATGAVVAGATVVVENEATNLQRSATSDAQGDYRLVNLDPGTYTVTVSSSNFSTVKNEHVIVPARETVRTDVKLAVKSAQEQVIVTSGQEVVSENLTTSNSLSGQEIDSLALNFRATNAPSPIGTAALTPTVNEDPGGNLTFAGQLPTATSFSLDGISIQLARFGGPTRDLFPSVEGISEFRVNTAGNSAEYAQPTDLTVVTRSGTNRFHGSGFWFFQRKDWNSPDHVSKQLLSADADTFGASAGGPIWKNHTFFFFDYEGVRLDQNASIQTLTLPTAWTQGDFSGVTGLTLINPLSGQPFPTNNLGLFLPPDPTTAKIMPLFFPAPAGPNAGSNNIDLTGNNLFTSIPGKYSVDGVDGRLDHELSRNHHVFGRITHKQITSTGTDGTAATNALGATGDSSYNPLQGVFSTTMDLYNLALSYNWILRPNLVNELRGGWSRMNFNYSFPQAAQGDSIISSLGITGLPGKPANGLGGVPVFYIGGLMGGATNQYGHPHLNKNGVIELRR
jgi:Carboxypeptidase regulatory-like domain